MIYGLRAVAIGGGTGLAALLAGLKHFVYPTPEPGLSPSRRAGPQHRKDRDAPRDIYFADLAALVTVTDDGGSSGRLRNELQMLPPGDIRNCLVALSTDESLLASLFQHRFGGSGGLGGHSFGNIFLAALTAVTGDFYEAVRAAGQVLSIEGRIFPSTTKSVSVIAELEDGSLVRGETNVSASQRPVRRISLDPPDCPAVQDSLQALEEADLILIGPGSLYTSLIPNLLVPGVADAIARSSGLVVYLCNIMTQPGETTGYGIRDHVQALLDHCPDLPLSFVLANRTPVPDEILERYRSEGAEQVLAQTEEIYGKQHLPCPLVLEDLLRPGDVVRHDGSKITRALKALFHRVRLRSSVT
jgi:uncharacterized cofD-like protein